MLDEISKREKGMVASELRDTKEDYIEDRFCYWYVFKDEPWYKDEMYKLLLERVHNQDCGARLFSDCQAFLEEQGYMRVKEPAQGDIVTYFKYGDGGEVIATHWAVYDKDDQVFSKYNNGHIFRRHIKMVPNKFGEGIFFMRKQKNT